MKKLLLLLIFSLFFVFSISAQEIIGKWELSSLQNGVNNQIEIIASITLNISRNNKISGSGGCNGFWGSYLLGKSNKIKFTKIISNTMLCEGITDFESTFFQSLQKAKTAKIKNGKLYFENNEKGIVLVFEKTN